MHTSVWHSWDIWISELVNTSFFWKTKKAKWQRQIGSHLKYDIFIVINFVHCNLDIYLYTHWLKIVNAWFFNCSSKAKPKQGCIFDILFSITSLWIIQQPLWVENKRLCFNVFLEKQQIFVTKYLVCIFCRIFFCLHNWVVTVVLYVLTNEDLLSIIRKIVAQIQFITTSPWHVKR